MTTSKEINITLGTNIKKLRTLQNLTREKLAESINVSPRFLADVEAGKVGVSLSTLKSLCKSLNASSDYLLGLAETEEKNIYISSIYNKIKNLTPEILKKIDIILDLCFCKQK